MAETPQLVLPFAEREFVDMARTCRILGVCWDVVARMAESGYLQLNQQLTDSDKATSRAYLPKWCN